MKHLHLRFILASMSFGFGAMFVLAAMWSVHGLSTAGWTSIRTTLGAVVMAAAGGSLLVFGFDGIRREMYGPTRRKRA